MPMLFLLIMQVPRDFSSLQLIWRYRKHNTTMVFAFMMVLVLMLIKLKRPGTSSLLLIMACQMLNIDMGFVFTKVLVLVLICVSQRITSNRPLNKAILQRRLAMVLFVTTVTGDRLTIAKHSSGFHEFFHVLLIMVIFVPSVFLTCVFSLIASLVSKLRICFMISNLQRTKVIPLVICSLDYCCLS